MTVKQVMQLGLGNELINDNTEIWIRWYDGEYTHVLAHGIFNQDDILKHLGREAESFVWQDDNNFYIDVK